MKRLELPETGPTVAGSGIRELSSTRRRNSFRGEGRDFRGLWILFAVDRRHRMDLGRASAFHLSASKNLLVANRRTDDSPRRVEIDPL